MRTDRHPDFIPVLTHLGVGAGDLVLEDNLCHAHKTSVVASAWPQFARDARSFLDWLILRGAPDA